MGVRVKKEKLPVLIMTDRFRIEAEVHVVSGGRLIDEINRGRDFIPLTAVTLYDSARDNRVETLDFLAISKTAIIFMTPLSAPPPSST